MAKKLEHISNFGDLKQHYLDAVAGKRVCRNDSNEGKLKSLVRGWSRKSTFYGPSSKDVSDWLHNGYRQEGLSLNPPVKPIRNRRRLMYGEEGELQLDLAWSGHDYPFLDWTKRETMPGMRIDVMFNFQAGTNVQVIIDYCRFALRSLIALENAGIDLEIWISSDSYSIFNDGDRNDTLYNHIQVKKEGEQNDYLGWSAVLSPGGFRHLMFLDYIIASDFHKRRVSGGLGHGSNAGQPWNIDYDVDERSLQFKCPWYPHTFPEAEMEMQLREVILNARKAA